MNGDQEGKPIHCGCVMVGTALVIGAVVILFTLGWRWLWMIPSAAVAFWVLMFVSSVFEGRWFAVTPEHVRRGVPARCGACGEELVVVLGATHFKTRCPICGHRQSGRWAPLDP